METSSAVKLYEEQSRVFWGTPSIGKKNNVGLILVNLGTPDNLDIDSIKKYLNEFLMDPYVVNLPEMVRNFLVKKLIIPFRAKKSLEAYTKIWTEKGSPLLVHSEALTSKISMKFPNLNVSLAMRYSGKSIDDCYSDLIAQGCRNILVLPLFPQYARATTGSIVAEVDKVYAKINIEHKVNCLPPFYNNDLFIKAWAQSIRSSVGYQQREHLVMSYHSLPVQQLADSNFGCRKSECFKSSPCPSFVNSQCYRAQCFATSRAIASQLGLSESEYTVAFQSKLGKAKWIKPVTVDVLTELAAKGMKNISVCCPSFVVDCLETIEEIGMQASMLWKEHGGDNLNLIPCLNEQPLFVESLSEHIRMELSKL
ncbi:MAG: ferrochelatase [Francisellaceae bacterium]|nr:ferrochelatase [Francisellaceae bacterium]MBT6538219.1 ferrochelatase [Francisellaceae bacterium]